jgi:hypothetical protein
VRRRRDQAHVAMAFAVRCVVRVDDQEAAYSPCEPAFGWIDTAA